MTVSEILVWSTFFSLLLYSLVTKSRVTPARDVPVPVSHSTCIHNPRECLPSVHRSRRGSSTAYPENPDIVLFVRPVPPSSTPAHAERLPSTAGREPVRSAPAEIRPADRSTPETSSQWTGRPD